eukprot:tig00000241_g21021.t1
MAARVTEPLLDCAAHFEEALSMGDTAGMVVAITEVKVLLTEAAERNMLFDVGVLSLVHSTFSQALASSRVSKEILRSCAFVLDVIHSMVPSVPEDDASDGRSSSAFTESSQRHIVQQADDAEPMAVCNFLAAKRPQGVALSALPLDIGLLDTARSFDYAPAAGESLRRRSADAQETRERVRSVALERKREELEHYRESGQRTVRRKGSRLFQYVFYRHQKPLKIDEREVRRVVEAVLEPPPGEPHARVTASKILIKIMMDMYKGAAEAGATLPAAGEGAFLLSLFLDMLASREPDTRAHAFTLLFNLSVHALMWDEPPEEEAPGGAPGGGGSGAGAPNAIDEALHGYLCEMLLAVLHADEREERVWSAALTLEAVDVRVLAALAARAPALCAPRGAWTGLAGADLIHARLLEALANRLYRRGPGENEWVLDEGALEAAGGVALLGEQLAAARSASARHNLFALLCDALFLAAGRGRGRPFPPEEGPVLAELLWRVGAPTPSPSSSASPPRLPRRRPPAHLRDGRSPPRSDLAALAGRVSREAAAGVLRGALRAAQALHRVPDELREAPPGLAPAQLRQRRTALVATLAASPAAADRRHVTAWLVELLRPLYEGPAGGARPVDESEAEALLSSLAASRAPEARRVYVAVAERLALGLFYAGRTAAVGPLLGGLLGKLVTRGERDEARAALLAAMDALATFLVRAERAPLVGAFAVGGCDTAYGALLEGQAGVCGALLAEVDARFLLHLATSLSPRSSADARAAALALLLRKCRAQPEALASLGGAPRIAALLDTERDPRGLLMLSEFVLEAMRDEPASEAQLALALRAAREAGDPELLSNPYLQARALLQSAQPYPSLPPTPASASGAGPSF